MSALGAIYLDGNPNANIVEYVTDLDVSLTLDEASQITITVHDPGMQMLNANYFQIRQKLNYLGMRFEIAAIDIGPGVGNSPQFTLSCRPESVQALKRWKIAEVLNVATATDYAAQKARDVGLAFFGEESAARGVVNQVNNDKADESVWDVLGKLAGELGFARFEMDNRLFFASEAFLLGKFGLAGYGQSAGFLSIPVRWYANPLNEQQVRRFAAQIDGPPLRPLLRLGDSGREVEYAQKVLRERCGLNVTDATGFFGPTTDTAVRQLQLFMNLRTEFGVIDAITWRVLDFLAAGVDSIKPTFGSYYITPLGIPSVRISDDAYSAAEASFYVERNPGKSLRPGMTVSIEGLPGFAGNYLVTSVSWREGTAEPVSVSARTLVEPKPSEDGNNAQLDRFRRSLSLAGAGTNTTFSTELGNSG